MRIKRIPRYLCTCSFLLVLGACGGGGASSGSDEIETEPDRNSTETIEFTVGGTITGSEDDYVTLSLNGVVETFDGPSFTFSQKLDAGDAYNVTFVSSGSDIRCTVINGTGIAEEDVLGVSVSCIPREDINYLCLNHSNEAVTVLGNNTYEFVAAADECFGTTEDFSLAKRQVPVSLNLAEEFDEIISVSEMAKLTTKEVPGGLGTYTTVTLSVELTNESEAVVCLDFEREGALVRDGETEMAYLQTEILGDMFHDAERGLNGIYMNSCIPAGQTRIVWGRGSHIYGEGDLENLDNIYLQPKDIEVYALDEDHYFLPALTPNEAVWKSTREEIAGRDYYGYEITVSFSNETETPLMLRSQYSTLYYFDVEGYFLYKNLASVYEYLDIDEDDLTDAGLLINADGGEIGLKDQFYPIVPAVGATGQILGRANKVIMSLNLCAAGDC